MPSIDRLRGFYKSTMVKKFLELLEPNWSIHSIGVASSASLRGSVTGKAPNYVFHPPGILLGNMIAIPEFHNITEIKGACPVLLDWWGTGDVSVDLVKVSGALQNEKVSNLMKKYGVEVLDGRYRFHTDSVGIAACHTETDKLNKFPQAVYDRLLVLYHEPEVLTSELAKEVAKRAKYVHADNSALKEAWKFYHSMRVDGRLPEIPNDWFDVLPEVGPRLISNFCSTVYAHAFIMQPNRYGYLDASYPELILDIEDLHFARDRIGIYKFGQEVVMEQMRGIGKSKSVKPKVVELFEKRGILTSKEVGNIIGCTPRRIRQIFKTLESEGLVTKIGSVGRGTKWKWKEDDSE